MCAKASQHERPAELVSVNATLSALLFRRVCERNFFLWVKKVGRSRKRGAGPKECGRRGAYAPALGVWWCGSYVCRCRG